MFCRLKILMMATIFFGRYKERQIRLLVAYQQRFFFNNLIDLLDFCILSMSLCATY